MPQANRFQRSITLIGLGILLLGTGCASSPPPPPSVEGEHFLSVEVEGLDCCEGALHVALYHDEDFWLREDGMVRGQVTLVTGSSQIVEFAGLPAGRYAVAAFQDLNGNAEFDFLFGLLPREPYGFSNVGSGLRPPAFDAAAVAVPDAQRVRVEMREPPL